MRLIVRLLNLRFAVVVGALVGASAVIGVGVQKVGEARDRTKSL